MRTKMMGLASGLIAITAGLALNASVAEAQNVSPTFNCNQRLNATERAICNNDDLAYLDQDMVAVYNQLPQFVNSSRWRQIRNEQRQWLKTRNSCGANVGCIRRTVNRRVGVLNTYMPGNLPDQPPQVFNPPPPPPPPPPPRPPVNQGGQGGIGGIFGNQPTNPPVQDVVAQYSCNSGAQVQVTYMNTSNPPTAELFAGGQYYSLVQGRSGSGSYYSNGNIELFSKGPDITIQQGGRSVSCTNFQ
jgi:uncharacterized protein